MSLAQRALAECRGFKVRLSSSLLSSSRFCRSGSNCADTAFVGVLQLKRAQCRASFQRTVLVLPSAKRTCKTCGTVAPERRKVTVVRYGNALS